MKHFITLCIATMIATGLFVSCRDDAPYNGPENKATFSMVTFLGNEGNDATYLWQAYEDSPEITLVALNQPDKKMTPGKRTMLYYYPSPIGASDADRRNIILIQKIATAYDTIRVTTPEKIDDLSSSTLPIKLSSVWRTGNYLNFDIMVKYSEDPQAIALLVDSNTANRDTVDAYLLDIFEKKPISFFRRAFASFMLDSVWQSPSLKALRVHIDNVNYPEQTYVFAK